MDEEEINEDLWKAAGTIDLLQQDLADAVELLTRISRPFGVDFESRQIQDFLNRPSIKKITEGK